MNHLTLFKEHHEKELYGRYVSLLQMEPILEKHRHKNINYCFGNIRSWKTNL